VDSVHVDSGGVSITSLNITEVAGSLNIATIVDIDASSAVTSGVAVSTDGALSTDLTHLSAVVTADSDATEVDSAGVNTEADSAGVNSEAGSAGVNTVADSAVNTVATIGGRGLASGGSVAGSLTSVDGVSLTVAAVRISLAIAEGVTAAVSEIAPIGAGFPLGDTV